jgi:hypothetical protein
MCLPLAVLFGADGDAEATIVSKSALGWAQTSPKLHRRRARTDEVVVPRSDLVPILFIVTFWKVLQTHVEALCADIEGDLVTFVDFVACCVCAGALDIYRCVLDGAGPRARALSEMRSAEETNTSPCPSRWPVRSSCWVRSFDAFGDER